METAFYGLLVAITSYVIIISVGSMLLASRQNLKFKRVYAKLTSGKVVEVTDYEGDTYICIKYEHRKSYWADFGFLGKFNIANHVADIGICVIDYKEDGTISNSWLKTWRYI